MDLITNLLFAQLKTPEGRTLRFDCHALVFEGGEALFPSDPSHQTIQGLGPDSKWPVFTLWLDCNHRDYELTPAVSKNSVILSDGDSKPRPLLGGTNLQFKDGTQLFLQTRDFDHPIDVESFDNRDSAYTAMAERVRRYYIGPYFPVVQYVPLAFA